MTRIAHYADILAVPCFAVAVVYFHKKHNRTLVENFLYLFVIVGLLFDTFSVYYLFKYL